jgi:hypothetical protein
MNKKNVDTLAKMLIMGGALTASVAIGLSDPVNDKENKQALRSLAAAEILSLMGIGALAFNKFKKETCDL